MTAPFPDPTPKQPRPRVHPERGTTSRTKQSFREESDVNSIMRKYLSTGMITHLAAKPPQYGDFTNVDDYLSAMTRVRAAEADFQRLPATVRDYVDNDPAELVRLVNDPVALQAAIDAGIFPTEGLPQPAPAPTATPAPEAAPAATPAPAAAPAAPTTPAPQT